MTSNLPTIIAYVGTETHDWVVRKGTQRPPKGYSPAYTIQYGETPVPTTENVPGLPFWVRNQADTMFAELVPTETPTPAEPLSWDTEKLSGYGLTHGAVTLEAIGQTTFEETITLLRDLTRLDGRSFVQKLAVLVDETRDGIMQWVAEYANRNGWEEKAFANAVELLAWSSRPSTKGEVTKAIVDPTGLFLEVAETDAPGRLGLQDEAWMPAIDELLAGESRSMTDLLNGERTQRETLKGIFDAYLSGVSPYDLRVVRLTKELSSMYRVVLVRLYKERDPDVGQELNLQDWAYRVLHNSNKVTFA